MTTEPITPSPELQEWLEVRENAFKVRKAISADGGHMMLKQSVFDPEELPEPLRTEAIEYLNLQVDQPKAK